MTLLDNSPSPKEQRRRLILDTMRSLLAEKPEEDISAGEIARLCDISVPTIYNLVGTRDQMLGTLINEFVRELDDRVRELGLGQPIEAAAQAVDISTSILLHESPVYRQVVRRLGGADASMGTGATRLSVDLQTRLIKAGQDQGLILPKHDAHQIGRQIVLTYNGTMVAWARHMLTDETFRAQALYNFHTTIAAFGADPVRADCLKRLARLARKLPRI